MHLEETESRSRPCTICGAGHLRLGQAVWPHGQHRRNAYKFIGMKVRSRDAIAPNPLIPCREFPASLQGLQYTVGPAEIVDAIDQSAFWIFLLPLAFIP